MDDEIDPNEFRLVPQENAEISNQIKELKEMLIDAADSDVKQDEASVLCSLGLAYFKLENFDLAREYQEKYLALSTELEDLKGQARANCNLGCVFKVYGEYTKAKEHFETAIAIGHENDNDKVLARTYNNLANIYELQENLPEALECHQKRLAIAHKINDKNGIGKACASLGNLYHVMGDLESSIHYYQEMLKILRDKLRVQDTLADESESGEDDDIDLDMFTMEQMADAQEKLKAEGKLGAIKGKKFKFHNPFLKKSKKKDKKNDNASLDDFDDLVDDGD